jgi:hypothetical protein
MGPGIHQAADFLPDRYAHPFLQVFQSLIVFLDADFHVPQDFP